MNSKLYQVAEDYEPEDSLKAPPAYKPSTLKVGKNDVSRVKKKRQKVKCKNVTKKEVKSGTYTIGALNTKVKQYSKYELNYHRNMIELGFFDVIEEFDQM